MSNKTENKCGWYAISNLCSLTYEEWLLNTCLRRLFNYIQCATFSQQLMLDENNSKYYIADFILMPYGIVIEADGNQHKNNIEYDSSRDRFLESMGLIVLRFDNQIIREHLREVLITIIKACKNRVLNIPTKELYYWLKKSKEIREDIYNNLTLSQKDKLYHLHKQYKLKKSLYKEANMCKYTKKEIYKMIDDIIIQMFSAVH
jgi:very-short-patch-repair endonuclease